jgi:hypothetical protein
MLRLRSERTTGSLKRFFVKVTELVRTYMYAVIRKKTAEAAGRQSTSMVSSVALCRSLLRLYVHICSVVLCIHNAVSCNTFLIGSNSSSIIGWCLYGARFLLHRLFMYFEANSLNSLASITGKTSTWHKSTNCELKAT